MKTRVQIEECYTSLTKTEKRIAEFILQDKDDSILTMTLSELSNTLKLGEATIIRFCRRIQFSGFQDLKLALALDRAQKQEKQVTENNSISSLVMQETVVALQNTNKSVKEEELCKAAAILADGGMVYFYGIGSSGIAALMAEDRFLRVGKACKAVNDPHLQRVQSAILGVKDIIVAISLSGSSNELYQALQIAKENGSTIIAITNHMESTIAKLSDCVLQTKGFESIVTGGTFISVISQLHVLDLLYTAFASSIDQKQRFDYQQKTAKSLLKNQ